MIRMLVNCAGYGVMGNFTKLNRKEELGMIDVNCKALTDMTYLCIPYMRKNSRIIQLASSAAFMPQPYFCSICGIQVLCIQLFKSLIRRTAQLQDLCDSSMPLFLLILHFLILQRRTARPYLSKN